MKKILLLTLISSSLVGCVVPPEKIVYIDRPVPVIKPTFQPKAPPKPANPLIGTWRGENTIIFNSNGKLIFDPSGREPLLGQWTAEGDSAYSLMIGNYLGRFLLITNTMGTLTIDGRTIKVSKY